MKPLWQCDFERRYDLATRARASFMKVCKLNSVVQNYLGWITDNLIFIVLNLGLYMLRFWSISINLNLIEFSNDADKMIWQILLMNCVE